MDPTALDAKAYIVVNKKQEQFQNKQDARDIRPTIILF